MKRITRREAMAICGGAGLALTLPARASSPIQATIDAFANGALIRETGVLLDVAPSVESGANVPIRIEVQAGAASVEAMMLIAPKNPRPVIAEFAFGSFGGGGRIATRIRLAESQEIIVLARLRGGQVHLAKQVISVAVGGCGI